MSDSEDIDLTCHEDDTFLGISPLLNDSLNSEPGTINFPEITDIDLYSIFTYISENTGNDMQDIFTMEDLD
jgi:hypothetical protein